MNERLSNVTEKPPRIAVTSVGGGSGQSVLKALMESPLIMQVYALDITPLSAGLYWPVSGSKVLPKPEDDLEAWKVWLVENAIDLLIPGADRDLPPLAAVAAEWKANHICRVAVSSPEMVAVADDKRLTNAFLKEHALPRPHVFPLDEKDTYPVIIKPSHGAASRGFHVCNDFEAVKFYFHRTEQPIIQEYIEGDEYTCALFFDIDHQPVAKFALKRWLRGGDTWRAQTVNDARLNLFLDTLAGKLTTLKPFGPINVQLRERDGQFYVLEFNARCSGTTALRAHFGYNEPEMLVRHICLREPLYQPDTSSGFVLRHLGETYLSNVTEAQMLGVKAEAT